MGGQPHFLSSILDITGRKQAQEALRESEERFRLAVTTSPDAICITRLSDGHFVEINDGFTAMTGYTRDDVADRSSNELNIWKYPEDRERIIGLLMENGYCANQEYIFQRKDGSLLTGSMSASFMTHKDDLHIISITRDVTDRKLAELEKLELERRLLHSQKLESLGVMAGGIAHDFNNLLQVILGNLELALMERFIGSQMRVSLDSAFKAAKRCAELSGQMLTYSGRTMFGRRDLDLGEILEENADILKSAVPKTCNFSIEIPETLPHISGDRDYIQQVLVNLVTNAADAVGDKAGEVRLEIGVMDCSQAYLGNARLEATAAPGRFVFLEVTDNGCGMDAKTQERLFDPFFSTKFVGRGLGMPAVLGIVRAHNGALMVESGIGKGTTIRVLFPVHETER